MSFIFSADWLFVDEVQRSVSFFLILIFLESKLEGRAEGPNSTRAKTRVFTPTPLTNERERGPHKLSLGMRPASMSYFINFVGKH